MKDLLVQVLTKELGIGIGIAQDIANACTPEQLEAVTEYLQKISQSPTKHRIDNFDKYAVMMMTAFKTAALSKKPDRPHYHNPRSKGFAKASQRVKEAHMDSIREFLNGR